MKNSINHFNVIITEMLHHSNEDVYSTAMTFNDLKNAQAYYNNACRQINDTQGAYGLVELYDSDDNLIESAYQKSKEVPKGAIIVTYEHISYHNYAYKIVDVRKAYSDETYEHLNAVTDMTNQITDIVFDTYDELLYLFENRKGFFEKMQSGRDVVDAFIESLTV